mgnify:CR=1 FL=1
MECLANAAVIDLRNGVREYIALPELAVALYEQGDINRAYRYLHRSIDDAAACNAKIRTMEMSNTMPLIDAAYNARQNRLRQSLHIAIGAVMVLAVLLGIASGLSSSATAASAIHTTGSSTSTPIYRPPTRQRRST